MNKNRGEKDENRKTDEAMGKYHKKKKHNETNKMNHKEIQKQIQENLNLIVYSSLLIAVMILSYSIFENKITAIFFSSQIFYVFILLFWLMVLLLIAHKHKVQT